MIGSARRVPESVVRRGEVTGVLGAGAETGAGAGVTCGRPREGDWVEVVRVKFGRNVDTLPFLLSNRSRRPLNAFGLVPSRTLTWWMGVRLALATRETGTPWLMTRFPEAVMAAEGVVWP